MSETTSYQHLLAGRQQPAVNSPETVESGQDLAKGSVLGKVKHEAGDANVDGENTGAGTITGEAVGPKAKVGTYTMIATGATEFRVYDPDGIMIGVATVDEEFTNDQVTFTLNDGDPDFVAGDSATFVVSEGSGEVKLADQDATDGSHEIYGVLPEAVDASSGSVVTTVYVRGEFNEDALVFADGEDADTYRDKAAEKGMFFRTVKSA